MSTPMVTIKMLKHEGACKDARKLFKDEWPDGAEVTLANVQRAQELGLDLSMSAFWFTFEAGRAYQEAILAATRAYRQAATEPMHKLTEGQDIAYEDYMRVVKDLRWFVPGGGPGGIFEATELFEEAHQAYWDAMQGYKRAYEEAIAPAKRARDDAVAQAWVDAFVASWPEIEARSQQPARRCRGEG